MTDSKVGNFTACYQSLFLKACDLGLNEVVALLVMACGAGKDHKTTSWSANAIEAHGGISRRIASKAIDSLEKHNIVLRVDDRPKSKPQYKILGDDSEMIWLPNSFIMSRTGKNGEDIDSPLKKIRRDGGLDYLLVIFFLYKYHNLPSDGGFERDLIHKKSRLNYLQEWGAWSFYTVSMDSDYTINNEHPIFDEIGMSPGVFSTIFNYLAYRYHLIQESLYLFDDSGIYSEMLYPVQGSENFESAMRDKALSYIDNQEQRLLEAYNSEIGTYDPLRDNTAASERAWEDKPELYEAIANNKLIIPIPQHLANKAGLFAVYKMKYRPITSATRAWQAKVTKGVEYYSGLFG